MFQPCFTTLQDWTKFQIPVFSEQSSSDDFVKRVGRSFKFKVGLNFSSEENKQEQRGWRQLWWKCENNSAFTKSFVWKFFHGPWFHLCYISPIPLLKDLLFQSNEQCKADSSTSGHQRHCQRRKKENTQQVFNNSPNGKSIIGVLNVHDTLNSFLDFGIDQGSQYNQNLYSGDLAPRRPEDDELMADLTEDELKAAFRSISLRTFFLLHLNVWCVCHDGTAWPDQSF